MGSSRWFHAEIILKSPKSSWLSKNGLREWMVSTDNRNLWEWKGPKMMLWMNFGNDGKVCMVKTRKWWGKFNGIVGSFLEWSFRGTGSSDYLMEIFNRCIVLACVPILLNVYGAFLIKRVWVLKHRYQYPAVHTKIARTLGSSPQNMLFHRFWSINHCWRY